MKTVGRITDFLGYCFTESTAYFSKYHSIYHFISKVNFDFKNFYYFLNIFNKNSSNQAF